MIDKLKYLAWQKIIVQLNQFRKPRRDSASNKPTEFYSNIVLGRVSAQISAHFIGADSLEIIDGGCGTGRIAIELAKKGHRVTGIDHHRLSLTQADINAKRGGVSLHLIHGDLLKYLQSIGSKSYDIGNASSVDELCHLLSLFNKNSITRSTCHCFSLSI